MGKLEVNDVRYLNKQEGRHKILLKPLGETQSGGALQKVCHTMRLPLAGISTTPKLYIQRSFLDLHSMRTVVKKKNYTVCQVISPRQIKGNKYKGNSNAFTKTIKKHLRLCK